MCPRATAQQGGAAMTRAAATSVSAASVHFFGEEEYIDLDLSSCGVFEFRMRRSCADELLYRREVAAATHKAVTKIGAKTQEIDAGSGGCGGGRRSAATVAPLQQHSHSAEFRDAQPAARARAVEGSRRRKAARTVQAKLQASRAFFRSLFVRTSCSDDKRCHGAPVRVRARATPYGESKMTSSYKAPFGEIKNGNGGFRASDRKAAPTTLRSSIEQEKLMDEEEHATAAACQRKSFSGVIRWRHAATSPSAALAPVPKQCFSSSSARRLSGAGGGVGAGPALKRSNSAGSESEGLIQGAIAYCKRSQQQLGLIRKSVSDAATLRPGPPLSWPSNPTRSAPAYCYY